MKRLLFGALAVASATAALAAPASAQANTADAPLCYVGEPYIDCAERITTDIVDTAVGAVFYQLHKVEELCRRSLSNCPL